MQPTQPTQAYQIEDIYNWLLKKVRTEDAEFLQRCLKNREITGKIDHFELLRLRVFESQFLVENKKDIWSPLIRTGYEAGETPVLGETISRPDPTAPKDPILVMKTAEVGPSLVESKEVKPDA